MNVAGNSEMNENTNVVPLFSTIQIEMPDPLQELLNEAEAEAWEADEAPVVKASRVLVSETQFPDQSMYTLEAQLAKLNQSLGRLKFYVSDLDDLLPR
jgi:hypothetical protein